MKHYIAVDWAQKNMAIARMTGRSNKVTVIDVASDIGALKHYLSELKGEKVLTFEESTGSQWLYTELRPSVDELVVCDPYRNSLLKEGAKTDKVDAEKLVKLLRAGMLKEVYHSDDKFIFLRRVASAYFDLIKMGVRLKNQRAAIFRASGKSKRAKELDCPTDKFILDGLDSGIEYYEYEKQRYKQLFEDLSRKHPEIGRLCEVSGLGPIRAVTIAALVVDGERFATDRRYWSYCGLVKHRKISGGRDYGARNTRYNRTLKWVYKGAAMSVIGAKDNPIKDYYDYLRTEKRYPDHVARHAVSRRLASISLAMLKSGKRFDPKRLKTKA